MHHANNLKQLKRKEANKCTAVIKLEYIRDAYKRLSRIIG